MSTKRRAQRQNGPVWPQANSIVADALAAAARAKRPTVPPVHLGHLLQRYGLLHCEGADPAKLLLRESGSSETGEMVGGADTLHSTFNDLIIRHAAGLVPRFDDVLEVRPLALQLGDFAIEDIPYHGHWVGIAVEGEKLTVTVDGEELGQGSTARGLSLQGFLR